MYCVMTSNTFFTTAVISLSSAAPAKEYRALICTNNACIAGDALAMVLLLGSVPGGLDVAMASKAARIASCCASLPMGSSAISLNLNHPCADSQQPPWDCDPAFGVSDVLRFASGAIRGAPSSLTVDN